MPTLFNGCGFDPPSPFTVTSIWSWIGHPVSGLRLPTMALFTPGFPAAPDLKSLTLPVNAARRTVLQKVRRRTISVLRQFVNTGLQVLFHSPPGVLFTVPSQYCALSVTKEYSALEGGPPVFPQGFSCLVVLRILPGMLILSPTGLSPSPAGLSSSLPVEFAFFLAVLTPGCTHPGLGSSAFARRYLRNHSYFFFLWLLRCFSSPGSLRHTMDSCDGTGRNRWVPPFRHLRINAYVQLPGAFRSLSRLSSALSAKASALRLSSLNLFRTFL